MTTSAHGPMGNHRDVDGRDDGPAVVVRNLVVDLGSRRRAALTINGLDLTLDVGIHGLLGPNGAGKTTLMRVLATVISPSSGEVRLFGRGTSDQASLRKIRRELGYLPQSFGYYPRFTVREFVAYFAWLKELRSPHPMRDVDLAIDRVGLSKKANVRMKSLSGGMLRRAGLAQAMVNAPKLLLLDEPTAGLDPEQRLDFRALLRDLSADTAVLVSTHLIEDVATACTSVNLMDSGRLVWSGSPGELEKLGAAGAIRTDRTADTSAMGISDMEAGYSEALARNREQN